MKKLFIALATGLLFSMPSLLAQNVKLGKHEFVANGIYLSKEKLMGKEVVKVIRDSTITTADEPTFALLKGVGFHNGVIEVKVLSRLLKNASPSARGFIGVSFRVNDSITKFENFYIRPTNGRADDQVRRNHSTQYFSYPDYPFDRFRKESPEKYESYADMGLNEWITMRIEVKGQHAKLFLNNSKQPVLIVNDLKHGADGKGNIGLWVDGGTEGYFTDLRITKQD